MPLRNMEANPHPKDDHHISKTCIFTGENPFIWDISGARYPIPHQQNLGELDSTG